MASRVGKVNNLGSLASFMGVIPSARRMKHVDFSGIRDIFEECRRLEESGMDIVHLEIGRPDFDTPAPIKQAGIDAIEAGKVHYTSNYGIRSLREEIAAKFQSENGLDYDPGTDVLVTAGVTEAVFTTVMAFIGDGDEVLVPNPSWTYDASIRMAGGTPIGYPLSEESGFQPDIKAVKNQVTDATKLMIVNSPGNPTGGILTSERARELADVAIENDLIVLSDEIYEKLRYTDNPHVSLADINGLYDRTVTVNGVSKAYSMTGWRLGYIGAPESLIDPIVRVRQYTTTCAPSISQYAAQRALRSDLHQPLVEAFSERRDHVVERLADIPGMECPPPSGALYAFPTLPDGVDDDREFVHSLLADEGVALVPGSVFGSNGSGHVRIAFSNSIDRIDDAFDRLEHWIDTVGWGSIEM